MPDVAGRPFFRHAVEEDLFFTVDVCYSGGTACVGRLCWQGKRRHRRGPGRVRFFRVSYLGASRDVRVFFFFLICFPNQRATTAMTIDNATQ